MKEEFIVACRGRRKEDASLVRFARITVRQYTGAVDVSTTPYAHSAERMPNDRAALVAELLSQLLPADGPRWVIEDAPEIVQAAPEVHEMAPAPMPAPASAAEEVAF